MLLIEENICYLCGKHIKLRIVCFRFLTTVDDGGDLLFFREQSPPDRTFTPKQGGWDRERKQEKLTLMTPHKHRGMRSRVARD
jgi:hypothetical protein